MADIKKTFTIPDALVAEMIEVFSQGYEATITNEEGEQVPNPQTRAQYASQKFDETVKLAIRRKVVDYRQQQQVVSQEFNIT